MTLKVFNGNILDSSAKYIAHQTNCISTHSAGLAKQIFERFPYADVYSERALANHADAPGTIAIRGDGKDHRFIIGMMAQYFPGAPKYPESTKDGALARKRYFFSCLEHISKIPDLESIAFPYGIGCGMAGGDWKWYEEVLEKFANYLGDEVSVDLYRLT